MGDEQEQDQDQDQTNPPDGALTGSAGPAPAGGLSPQGDGDDQDDHENRDPQGDADPEPAAPGEEDGADGAKEIVEADDEPVEQPEPGVMGFVNQDNVTEPGVQTTKSPFGESSHGEPLESSDDEPPATDADEAEVVGEGETGE